jgi:hypothetical protein
MVIATWGMSRIGGYRQVEVTRMPVYRKAEEPYGCGWVRNRQRRSWGGSNHTRYTDEAPILKKNRGFIP